MKPYRNPKSEWKKITLSKEGDKNFVQVVPFQKDNKLGFYGLERYAKKLRDLMGAGYTIVKDGGGTEEGKRKPQQKDPTKEIGGKKPIQKTEKGGKRGKRNRGKGKKSKKIEVAMKPQLKGSACLSPYEMDKPTRQDIEKAKAAKDVFAKLAGLSENKVISPPRINVFELTKALELGTDPLPALEFRHEDKALPKIGIVIDNSGSCHAFSGAARCMGDAIVEAANGEVTVGIGDIPNFDINSEYAEGYNELIQAFASYLHTCDVILYVGDYDGWYGGNGGVPYFASLGKKIITLCNRACNYGNPVISNKLKIDNVAWVDRVDLKDIDVIISAIELAIAEF